MLLSLMNLFGSSAYKKIPPKETREVVSVAGAGFAYHVKRLTGLDVEVLLTKVVASCASLLGVYLMLSWLLKKVDPTHNEKNRAREEAKKILKKLRLQNVKLTDYELAVAVNLVDPEEVNVWWEQIGGLEDVVRDIKHTVIFPLINNELQHHSRLHKAPRGVLLYGPPGCGKTLIAKAIATDWKARFFNLDITTLVDKWYGESQKRMAGIFSLASKVEPTVIFIDEIDSLLRLRSMTDNEVSGNMKMQVMNYIDGLQTKPNSGVLVIGATNNKDHLDPAILRRLPCQFYIGLPDVKQRNHILDIILKDEQLNEDVDLQHISRITNMFSGSDLEEACRQAASYRISEYLDKGQKVTNLRPITMNDFEKAVLKLKQTLLSHSFISH